MNGMQKCKLLKDIRKQIAEENDIDLVIEACTHKGDCRGTCPRCEAEVEYLERELEKRRQLKKRVALVGVSAGVTLALSGCALVDAVVSAIEERAPIDQLSGAVVIEPTHIPEEVIEVLDGEVAPYEFSEYN